MIRPEELRIGNYVKYNGMVLSVIGINHPVSCEDKRYIDKWVIYLLCDGIITSTVDEIDPVNLTEELLLKFGFVKFPDSWQFRKKMSALDVFVRVNRDKCYFEIGGIYMGEITHVHRLQNIWHSLSNGHELVKTP